MLKTGIGSTSLRLTATVAGLAALAALTAALMTAAPRTAEARAAFTQQTSLPCAKCHTTAPALSDFGKAFKANGNKVPK